MKINPKFLVVILIFLLAGCSWGGSDAGLYKTTDSGDKFEKKDKLNEKKKTIGAVNVLNIKIDPVDFNRVYLGTETGVFRSGNGGDTWEKISNLERAYGIAIDQRNNKRIYLTGIEGGRAKVKKSENDGKDWQDVFVEPALENMVIPSLLIDSYEPDTLYIGDSRGIMYKTTDQGNRWEKIAELGNAILKIEHDLKDTRDLYVKVHETGLFKLDHVLTKEDLDRLAKEAEEKREPNIYQNANKLSEGPIIFKVSKGPITALAIDPKKPGVIYLSDTEGLFKSEDFALHWNKVNTIEGPGKLAIRDISITGVDSQIIYYGTTSTFYRSLDSGKTWENIELKVSSTIEVLEVKPDNEKVIYLGTRVFKK